MLRLAITGNIGCGKSTVGKILQDKYACPLVDSDILVHQLLETAAIKQSILTLVASHSDVLSNNGQIDRKKLGEVFFREQSLKKEIEAILHPAVRAQTEKFFAEQEKQEASVAANLIPLLFETSQEHRYDRIWLIYCQPKVQITRLQSRNPELSLTQIQARIEAQMPQEQKRSRADTMIDNSATIESTTEQIEAAWQTLIQTTPSNAPQQD